MSDVIDFFRRGPVVTPGGSPSATAPTAPAETERSLADELREMARQLDAGDLEYQEVIVIGTDEIGTCLPHVFGGKVKTRELIGVLEITKMLVMDACWTGEEE